MLGDGKSHCDAATGVAGAKIETRAARAPRLRREKEGMKVDATSSLPFERLQWPISFPLSVYGQTVTLRPSRQFAAGAPVNESAPRRFYEVARRVSAAWKCAIWSACAFLKESRSQARSI